MLTINYKNILSETLISYKQNFIVNSILSTIFVIFLLLISGTFYFFRDNPTYYYISSVLLMLIIFYLKMILFKLALESSKHKVNNYSELTIKPLEFSNLVLNLFLQGLAYFLVSIPSIIAGFVLLVAFNNQIMPFDKTNFSFDDSRLALSGIAVYLFSFLIILLINIPFILYTFLRIAFSIFYIFDKKANYVESLRENIEDTKNVNFLSITPNVVMYLIFEIIAIGSIILASNVFSDDYQNKYPYLLFALIPIFIIPFQLIQLSHFYKKINQQK